MRACSKAEELIINKILNLDEKNELREMEKQGATIETLPAQALLHHALSKYIKYCEKKTAVIKALTAKVEKLSQTDLPLK